jgi:hypothetical protein
MQERLAGCNHMSCRCGNAFCWLCLRPLADRCGCPQFGGHRTDEAKARLSSPGWRRSVMLSSEGVALRTLAAALLGGLALHRTEDLVSCGTVVYQSVMSWSTLTKLFSLQFALGFVHLWAAQTSLRALPPDILLHMATRQIDLSLGGAGTSFALHFLRTLERLRLLPPQPGLASRGVVFRAITTAIATLVSDSRLSPSHAGTEPNGNVLVVPAVQDPNPRATRGPDARPYHDHRPFAFANNFSGYKIPRRCRAALPAVAAFAFACEVFFPCVAPLLLFQTLHLVTGCILCPFGWIAELLVRVASVCTVDDSWTCVVLSFTCLPRFLAYVVAAVGVVLVLGVAATISFMGNVTTLISLLSTLRETGVRRRVTARLVMDPEAELEELLDDQEMSYSIEDLKFDVVRLLLDARTLLFYVHTFLVLDVFSVVQWDTLKEILGPTGISTQAPITWRWEWELNPLAWLWNNALLGLDCNPLSWLWGVRLSAAVVCLNALVAHLEPVASTWCMHWTVCSHTPRAHFQASPLTCTHTDLVPCGWLRSRVAFSARQRSCSAWASSLFDCTHTCSWCARLQSLIWLHL